MTATLQCHLLYKYTFKMAGKILTLTAANWCIKIWVLALCAHITQASPRAVNQDGRQQCLCAHETVCGNEVSCKQRRKIH